MRFLFLIGGCASLLLGIVGIFLPIMPTTVFILLAAFLFSKSSPKFHSWLLEHRFFGKMIKNWQKNRSIPMKAKILALFTISTTTIFLWVSFWGTILLWIAFIISVFFVLLLLWMWRLPSS